MRDTIVFASGGLDEDQLQALTRAGAPIDGYGVGTSLTTSSDVPALDCAYKLQEYAGIPRRKRSEGKATWPGRKQIWRSYAADGTCAGDLLGLADEAREGRPLLVPAMRGGRRIGPLRALTEIRQHAAKELERLPESLKRLEPMSYPVSIDPALRRLAEECDRRSRG
jgi:nicotinate phosphoribosyltransferase